MTAFICAALLGLIVLLRTAPDTPFSRSILEFAIKRSCNWWLGLTRIDVLRVIVLAALVLTGGEMMMALGFADLVLAYALDLTIYLDAAVVASLVTGQTRLRGLAPALCAVLRRPAKRARRSVRDTKVRGPRLPANDDDRPVWRAAA